MIETLLARYPLISDQVTKQELRVLLGQLEAVLDRQVPGAIVEFGCYTGTTALFVQRLLQAKNKRLYHVYDSFAGLPPKSQQDTSPAGEQFKAGELTASKATFIKQFRQAGLPLPVIHKGWFADVRTEDMPRPIAWAFLDGDFYSSIVESLTLIWPLLAPGAAIAIDDYQSEALPGVKRAVDEWIVKHPCNLRTVASLALLDPYR